ncbi:MAG: hypothetical protein A2744_04030 [Candidatus Buchananbacteria bacterium RIFCSPHIGHO2_01_FULL_44_11]|uniref:Bis(5'-nucleosyl)-tetraphosphatase [asymmetrical] n=1 Tax=Candidatus Buchananbacteria bacterium RIFCSPHIGHO2_01_FULL_44_11 TaxID=1797535 RepID=A0A1G1Y1J6_9BACT|nr:MAG: hypothetical protein A2744_04030 [Candidatus Buchananbacteria bacterium RIFCSPHIGHO2_01_FULL_44_11]
MIKQLSVGFVVFRRAGKGLRYLLLHHGGEYWNFPKGRQVAGETELATALRELKEETGIEQVNLIKDFRFEYDYDFDTTVQNGVKEKVYKHAIFFLVEVNESEVKISDEHLDFGWFDFNTALSRLFYQPGQDCLKAAHQFLLKQQDFVL